MIRKLVISTFVIIGFFISCDRQGGSGKRGSTPAAEPPERGGTPAAEPRVQSDTRSGPVSYDVYIENSASMDGYVTTRGSFFRNDVQDLIKDLLQQKLADTVNLAYVSETICGYKHHAILEEVDSFTTLRGLKSCAASRKESLMDKIIDRVISANREHVAVLISDFIFSTGSGPSAEVLTQKQNMMENVLGNALAVRKDMSTIILKFRSGFDGKYYSETRGNGHNSAIDVTGKGVSRPYYVMIFGEQSKVRKLEDFYKLSRFAGYDAFENDFYLLPPGVSAMPAARLVRKERIGDFTIAGAAGELTLEKAAPDSTGLFQFALALNLDPMRLDEKYLMDTGSYELPANYRLAGIRKVNGLTEPALQGFSHVFLVQTTGLLPSQQVTVRLKTRMPKWVDSCSTIYDDNPTDPLQQRQTFGFSYLVRGIYKGYMDAHHNNMDQFGVTVSVNTGEASNVSEEGERKGGFPWVLLIVAGVVVVIVIAIKRKR